MSHTTPEQLAIITNTLAGVLNLVIVGLILLPEPKRPDSTPFEWWVMRVACFLVFGSECIRHIYLAWRQTYGFVTPSQATPIAIGANVVLIVGLFAMIVVGWRLKNRFLRERGG